MTPEIVSVALTGAGVLLGVWRILAHYATRNETVRVELTRRIDEVRSNLSGQIAKVTVDVAGVAADVAYLRGRQGERDRHWELGHWRTGGHGER